jgi:hypothetical protein
MSYVVEQTENSSPCVMRSYFSLLINSHSTDCGALKSETMLTIMTVGTAGLNTGPAKTSCASGALNGQSERASFAHGACGLHSHSSRPQGPATFGNCPNGRIALTRQPKSAARRPKFASQRRTRRVLTRALLQYLNHDEYGTD